MNVSIEGKPCSLRVKEEILPGHWDFRTYRGTFVGFERESGYTQAVIRISPTLVKRGWIYNLRMEKNNVPR
jgi:hypothetical protein